MNEQQPNAPHSKKFVWFLILTSLTGGSLIMVVEVLGSKVIGPFFGVSLFVWTSLIAVTMIALAGGYAFGGFMSDRRGHAADSRNIPERRCIRGPECRIDWYCIWQNHLQAPWTSVGPIRRGATGRWTRGPGA